MRRSKAWAEFVLSESRTKATKKQKLFPVFVYTGMSGIGSATGLMLAIHAEDPDFQFGMVYVRKPEEKSHGSRIEHQMDNHDGEMRKRFYFVDDFTCTGTSFARAMIEAFKSFGIKDKKFESKKVGLIEMNRTVEESARYRDNDCLDRAYNNVSLENESRKNNLNLHDEE